MSPIRHIAYLRSLGTPSEWFWETLFLIVCAVLMTAALIVL